MSIPYAHDQHGTETWADQDGVHESTEAAALLGEVAGFLGRFLAFPSPHCVTALALWAAHTHALPTTWYVTPRLVLDSAEPGSGKTRVLELLALLCSFPKFTMSTTTAALYRRIGQATKAGRTLTVLMDETDAVFGSRAAPQHEDLRALINSGYKRGATVDRCVGGDGKAIVVQEFPVFTPVALAGIAGKMPATITTRAVTIHMRRRAPGEDVEPFRDRDAAEEAAPLRTRVEGWVRSVEPALCDARPRMPTGVSDRPAEVWEALLALADEAGGQWPQRSRAACRYFVLDADPGDLSLGVRLLADIRDLYAGRNMPRMPSQEIVDALRAMDEAPWSDLWGKPLDTRRLAKELARYDVRPVQFKEGGKQRGYVTEPTTSPAQRGLADAWARYLPPRTGTAGTAGTAQLRPVPDQVPVPVTTGTARQTGTGLTSDVPPVPVVPQESRMDRWRRSGVPIDQHSTPNGRTHRS